MCVCTNSSPADPLTLCFVLNPWHVTFGQMKHCFTWGSDHMTIACLEYKKCMRRIVWIQNTLHRVHSLLRVRINVNAYFLYSHFASLSFVSNELRDTEFYSVCLYLSVKMASNQFFNLTKGGASFRKIPLWIFCFKESWLTRPRARWSSCCS